VIERLAVSWEDASFAVVAALAWLSASFVCCPQVNVKPRPWQPLHRAAARHRRALLAASRLALQRVLQRRHGRSGRSRQPLHSPRHRHRRPVGRRGWLTLSLRRLGPLVRSPRVRPLRHDPELGRGRGGKRRRGGSKPSIGIGRSPTSRATSPPTSCMTGRSSSCRLSPTAPSNGSPTGSWTTTRPAPTSRRSSATLLQCPVFPIAQSATKVTTHTSRSIDSPPLAWPIRPFAEDAHE